MKDIDLKATCPYKSDLKCNAAINALCDNKCCYHPRYVDDGLNENYKTHRCPYAESTTCSGETCGNDCCFHPDYDEKSGTDFRNDWGENAYINKKIDRADLDFDFDEDESECGLLKDKTNWKNGIGPCVGCERECPITTGMKELTYDDGYDQALMDCGEAVETSYLDGYKDGFYGEPPMVEDDELREALSESPETSPNYMQDAGIETLVDDFCVSGKVLYMVEDAKKKLTEIRREIYTSSINYDEKRLIAFKILKIVDVLDSVQHQYTSDAMYEYLGYME